MYTQYLPVPDLVDHEHPFLSVAVTCDQGTVIELFGDVDMSTTHLITELVTHVAKTRPAQVILDMSEVSFFCAAGITALLRARKAVKDAGGELLLRQPSTITMQILTMTRTADIFQLEGLGAPKQECVI